MTGRDVWPSLRAPEQDNICETFFKLKKEIKDKERQSCVTLCKKVKVLPNFINIKLVAGTKHIISKV